MADVRGMGCGVSEYVLTFGATPPTYNSYQRSHWRAQAKIKREWQDVFEGLLMVARVPRARFGRCVAAAELRFPTDRRRDAGNYRTPIEKSLGDALQQGWLPDDTHDRFGLDSVRMLPKGQPLLRLVLTFSGEWPKERAA